MDNERNWLTNKEIQKKCEDISKTAYKCKCGHTVVITNKSGIAICSFCKNAVFKDKKTEFEYRMKENLIRERRNLNEKYNSKEN